MQQKYVCVCFFFILLIFRDLKGYELVGITYNNFQAELL